MGWQLGVHGSPFVLSWLVAESRGCDPRVEFSNGSYQIVWSTLADRAEADYEKVRSDALFYLQLFEGLSNIRLRRHVKLVLARQAFVKPNGQALVFITMTEKVRVEANATAQLLVKSQAQGDVPFPQETRMDVLLKLASTDETLRKAIRLVNAGLGGWVEVCRLLELLEGECGGLGRVAQMAGLPLSRLQLVHSTANSPALAGDLSRHGTQKGVPPKNSISLEDAVGVIRNALHAWTECLYRQADPKP